MGDVSDWMEVSYATEPRGRGGIPLLVLGLILVLGLGVLGYVGVTLGMKALRFTGGFSSHTQTTKASPTGAWALVIDTVNEGGMGGSTRIVLKSAAGDVGYMLYYNEWLPDSAVRWRDARTVAIDGRLQMPFVEQAIATGSPVMSGVPLDSAGYVRNTVASGERVVMLSGLSLVLPHDAAGELRTRRVAAGHVPWQRFVSSASAAWSVETFRRRSDLPAPARAARLIGRSKQARIVLRWEAAAHRLYMITQLPGRMTGLITLRRVSAASAIGSRATAAELWRLLAVKGTALPWR